MEMLIEPLALDTPLAAFNGGVIVGPRHGGDRAEGHTRAARRADRRRCWTPPGLDVWLYRGADWLVRDLDAPHIARESFTVQFAPTLVGQLRRHYRQASPRSWGSATTTTWSRPSPAHVHDEFGDHVSAARSQPYYLDVTHPTRTRARSSSSCRRGTPSPTEQIATIGDMPNDVLMFAHSGLSIAMGQSDREVQRAARRVTTSNDDEGFADAVERFILKAHDKATLNSAERT